MSINLLPQKEKKHIKKLYKTRRMVAASWFVVALVAVSLISLVPLYLFSENLEVVTENKEAQLQAEDVNFNVDDIEKQINILNRKVRVLENNTLHTRVYPYITDITEKKRGGITIEGISFREIDENQVIELNGIANTRSTLLDFRRDLEQKEYSDAVELPISNFAQNVDIDFSITITLTEND